jgi:hypothetical protein
MSVRPYGAGFAAAISSVAFLGALGCGTSKPPVVDFSSAPRSYRAEDYPIVYQRWTRHEKVTHELEAVLEVWATFKSRDYREAFVAHYASAYSLSQADSERLRQSQSEAAATGYEFLITAQSANYRWNDLEKKSSPWKVTLVDGAGRELAPEEFKVEKLPDMFEREFFPVKTPFTKTYAARFPRSGVKEDEFAGERSGRIILRFAGPLGRADLDWSSARRQ